MLYPNPLCTWTKFQYSTSNTLDESTFEPLVARRTNYQEFFYGRITESPDHCILMIIWHSPKAYRAFQNSVQNDELLDKLKGGSNDTEPTTQIINFRGQMLWRYMKGPRNDVRITHFPDPISKETKQDISSVKGLRMAGNWGIIGNQNGLCLSAYRGPATLGWIEGSQTWNGQSTVACVWVHHWKSQEHEERFKATQRSPTETANNLLAVEDFDQSLTDLGAVGWEEFHVDFKQVWGSSWRRMSED